MAERDIERRDGDGSAAGSGRDPNALAAWRRVAEQRRRRQDGAPDGARDGAPDGAPDGSASPTPAGSSGSAGSGSAGGPGSTGTTGGALSRHDLLLAMAGRVDDDALATVRELVAFDDAAAAELLGGCLLADGVAVTGDERAQLELWFAGARVDPDLVDALPTDDGAPWRSRHRFLPDPPGAPDDEGETVARAAGRLAGVAHVRQSWRVTPAGRCPGSLPHRVVLVETLASDDREHVAHHVGHAAHALGTVSVEVYATDDTLPAYQRDAVAASRVLTGSAGPVPARPTAPPAATSTPAPPGPPRPPTPPTPPALPVRRRAMTLARPSAPDTSDTGDIGDTGEPGDDAVAEIVGAAGTHGFAHLGEDVAERDEPGDLEDLDDRRDTGGWRVVADADRGVAAAGRSTPEPGAGPAEPGADGVRGVGYDADQDAGAPAEVPIADLDPDAAAARIAALWREPSPVDAFDVPLSEQPWSPNLLEPDLPEPDLAGEMARFDTPRPVTGSFERIAGDPPPHRAGTRRHAADDDTPGDDTPGDDTAGDRPDRPAPLTLGDEAGETDGDGLEVGRIRRARHSRSGHDDEAGRTLDHDARFGAGAGAPWGPTASDAVFASPVDLGASPPADEPPGPATRGDEPPTGPLSLPGAFASGTSPAPPPSPAPSTPTPPAWSAETEDAVNSQLSDRERDLLARLHAELAAREGLESGEPDPFAPRSQAPERPTDPAVEAPTSPRPSPRPRSAGGPPTADAAPRNGHHHGPVNGHAHGERPRNGHALDPDPDPDTFDDGR